MPFSPHCSPTCPLPTPPARSVHAHRCSVAVMGGATIPYVDADDGTAITTARHGHHFGAARPSRRHGNHGKAWPSQRHGTAIATARQSRHGMAITTARHGHCDGTAITTARPSRRRATAITSARHCHHDGASLVRIPRRIRTARRWFPPGGARRWPRPRRGLPTGRVQPEAVVYGYTYPYMSTYRWCMAMFTCTGTPTETALSPQKPIIDGGASDAGYGGGAGCRRGGCSRGRWWSTCRTSRTWTRRRSSRRVLCLFVSLSLSLSRSLARSLFQASPLIPRPSQTRLRAAPCGCGLSVVRFRADMSGLLIISPRTAITAGMSSGGCMTTH